MNVDNVNQLLLIAMIILAGIIGGIKINNARKTNLRSQLQQCDQALVYYSKLDFYLWALQSNQLKLENPPQDLHEQSLPYLNSNEIDLLMSIHSKPKEEITQFYALIGDRVLKLKEEQINIMRMICGKPKKVGRT